MWRRRRKSDRGTGHPWRRPSPSPRTALSSHTGRAPKGPASARPAPGGRFSPARSGAALIRSWVASGTGSIRPARPGARQCLAFSRPTLPPQIPDQFPLHTPAIWLLYAFCIPPQPRRTERCVNTPRRGVNRFAHPAGSFATSAPVTNRPAPLTPAPGNAKGRTLRRGLGLVTAPDLRRARNIPSARYARRYPRPAPRRAAP